MKTTIILGIILVVAGVLAVARPTDGPGTETALAGASLPGDANCDEVVNSIDAAFVLQFGAALLSAVPCPDNADVNGDGNINALDAALILQFAAGLLGTIGSPPSATNTSTPMPTNTPVPSTSTPVPPTAKPSQPTDTPSAPSVTPMATDTPTPEDTPTNTPMNTATNTPTNTATSTPTNTPTTAPNCDPAYPDFCIPPPPPDLNCADIPYNNFTVLPPDPHGFDGNNDGVGCQS